MEYVNGGELFFHLSKERQFSEVSRQPLEFGLLVFSSLD
jgi:hypothetical protein